MSNIKLVHSGGNSVSLTTPDSNPAANRTFKLPGADGSSGQALVTDGSGALSFATVASPYSFTHWYLTADYVLASGESDGNSDDVVENWAESNAPGYVSLGSKPTYSSGQFTLPSTGYWRFVGHMIFYHTSAVGDSFSFNIRKSTDSGSSFNNVSVTGGRFDSSQPNNSKFCWTVSGIVKIDNISTNRVDIFAKAVASSGGARLDGGSLANDQTGGTHMSIEKMANL
tara:strand:+ start:688 stop:1368 length:681 start_codon:yes stop_codon:yes gene_type:complete